MSEQQREGGAEWELGQAATRMSDALASGDAEALRMAMSDHAAALGSQATSSMASLAAGLMRRLEDLSQQLDRSDAGAARYRGNLMVRMDSRFDTHDAELDRTKQELGAGLSRLQAGFQDMQSGLSAISETVDDLRISLAATDLRVAAITTELARVRADTIADELPADRRREIIATIEWIEANRNRIVLRDDDAAG